MAPLTTIPSIDYRRHPAFAGLEVPLASAALERTLGLATRQIDAAYAALRQGETGSFEDEIARPARALAGVLRGGLADAALGDWASRSVIAALPQLMDEIDVARRARPSVANEPRLTALRHDGYVDCALPVAVRDVLSAAAEPYQQQLLARATVEPGHSLWMRLPHWGALGCALRQWLDQAGVFMLAAAYRGVPMDFDHLSLHYSHARQSWFRDCYVDAGVPTSPLASLHTDKDTTSIKMLIYLHPVISVEDGAFCFLRGSHRWQRSPFRFALANQLDAQHHSLFHPPKPADGYFRPRFRDLASRARMLAMPQLFHGCSHFGCDLIDGDPELTALATSEVALIGDSMAVLFDGGAGLHRGGLVFGAPRWALQLGFRPVPVLGPLQRLRRVARSRWRRWQERDEP